MLEKWQYLPQYSSDSSYKGFKGWDLPSFMEGHSKLHLQSIKPFTYKKGLNFVLDWDIFLIFLQIIINHTREHFLINTLCWFLKPLHMKLINLFVSFILCRSRLRLKRKKDSFSPSIKKKKGVVLAFYSDEAFRALRAHLLIQL